MSNKSIILFGTMGAGKDTIANYLAEEYGYTKVKLGKYIRENCDKYNYQNFNNRKMMQEYGQICRQLFGKDVWNEVLYNSIQNDIELYKELDGRELNFAIADGRQLNEFDYWTKKGFITIGITADEEIRKQRLIKRDGTDQSDRFRHDTELQAMKCIKRCKYVIDNNRSIKEAVQAIKKIIHKE